MYNETDIEAAVAAGILSPAAADAFRNHVSALRSTPLADEESFRLLTGFNDIFVSIALALLLTALAWIGGSIWVGLGGIAVAAASWMLAEYFTRQRRMALPSILLLLSFVGGVAASLVGALVELEPDWTDQMNAVAVAGIGLIASGAAYAHWRRFQVPITVAAGSVAATGVIIALVLAASPDIDAQILWVILAMGLSLFAFAMWWDVADRARITRRSDVAFWLHLAAAPMIAHPIFHLLGVMDGTINIVQAFFVVTLYLLFALVSLSVDRRALLVSSLAYLLFAMNALFEKFGAVSLGAAFTAFIIGAALLLLSAFWHRARQAVVSQLPRVWHTKLPVIDRLPIPQPTS